MTDAQYYRLQAHKCWHFIDVMMRCCRGFKMPEATRLAIIAQEKSAKTFAEAAVKCEELGQ